MNISRKLYVVGLLFNEEGDSVILVQKRRPEWQKGRFNGPGGKVEPGEDSAEAMVREGLEEIGVAPDWELAFSVQYGVHHVLDFFAARDGAAFLDARALTDEAVFRAPVFALNAVPVIPNLRWIIPLARHHLFNERVFPGETIMMMGHGESVS